MKKIEKENDEDNNGSDKEVDDEDEDDESYDYTDLINKMGTKLASYKKNDAQITCHSAINLINRYSNAKN